MTTNLLAQARETKRSHVRDLLGKRNVVGVGLGYKVSHGVSTGELSVVVSVKRKEDPSALSAADLVPRSLDGVKTDVVETGTLRAFELGPRDRWRPVARPGVSIGHYLVSAGTFGCLVRRGEEVFILSNNHVLANVNDAEYRDAILQPGVADGGVPEDRFATLADFVPLDFGTAEAECPIAEYSVRLLNFVAGALGSRHEVRAVRQTNGVNRIDAALALPLSPDSVTNEILSIGAPIGVGTVTLGTEVQKSGRTTGYTQGTVTQIDATVRIDYHGRIALFEDQIVTSAMSAPGDSGSAILDMGNRVVGLLFAGSEASTIFNPIGEVLSALDVAIAV